LIRKRPFASITRTGECTRIATSKNQPLEFVTQETAGAVQAVESRPRFATEIAEADEPET